MLLLWHAFDILPSTCQRRIVNSLLFNVPLQHPLHTSKPRSGSEWSLALAFAPSPRSSTQNGPSHGTTQMQKEREHPPDRSTKRLPPHLQWRAGPPARHSCTRPSAYRSEQCDPTRQTNGTAQQRGPYLFLPPSGPSLSNYSAISWEKLYLRIALVARIRSSFFPQKIDIFDGYGAEN